METATTETARPEPQALGKLDLVRAERARRGLRAFYEQAWPVVEPRYKFAGGWLADALCEHLEAWSRFEIKNLVVNIHPRLGKSTLVCVVLPAWVWATSPDRKWLFFSYAAPIAVRDSLRCRRLIESPWYQSRWGSAFSLEEDQNAKSRYDTTASGARISLGVGGAATGEGGDHIVVDDPHDVRKADSVDYLDACASWWDNVISPRLNNPERGSRLIVMQRVHDRDLTAHVSAQKELGYEVLDVPAEWEPRPATGPSTSLGWPATDPRTREGEPLLPERFSREFYAAQRATLGAINFSSQFQQRPVPREGAIFKQAWVKFHGQAPGLRRTPADFDEVLQSWDCSFKAADDSSFVVGQVWGRLGPDLFLLDQHRERLSFTQTLSAMRRMTARWPQAIGKLVEERANGAAVLDVLRQSIDGLVATNPTESKESRAYAVQPLWEAGNVYLPDPIEHTWVTAYLDELLAFPKAENDDQVDAMTQALRRLSRGAASAVAGEAGMFVEVSSADEDDDDDARW